jgi:hypothetical protein
MRPVLAVTSLEIVQSVQRPDNSMPLFAGKRTVVRAFIDSGLRGGMDLGYGPDRLGQVTGQLRLSGPRLLDPIEVLPDLSRGRAVARPPDEMRRDRLSHSLNFVLPPGATRGSLTLELNAFQDGRGTDPSPGWRAAATAMARFNPVPHRRILPVLVGNSGLTGRPTIAHFLSMLSAATRRFPIPDDHFIVLPPRTLDLAADIDLSRAEADWDRAFNALRSLEDGTRTIVAGIVFKPMPGPTASTSTGIIGKGGDGSRTALATAYTDRDGPAPSWATMMSVAASQSVFAHELGHVYGLAHANGCGASDIDPRLPPDGLTDEIGLDTLAMTLFRRGTPETMSYCGPDDWLSTASYEGDLRL